MVSKKFWIPTLGGHAQEDCNNGSRSSDKVGSGAGGERSSRPWDNGGGWSQKNFFPPFGPKFGLKIRGEPGSLGPLPCIRHLTAKCPNNFNWDYNLKSIINKERFRNTFIKGKRQFEPRDQVFLLLFSFTVYDIYTHKKSFMSGSSTIIIYLHSFLRLIILFKKSPTWIWCLLFARKRDSNLSK